MLVVLVACPGDIQFLELPAKGDARLRVPPGHLVVLVLGRLEGFARRRLSRRGSRLERLQDAFGDGIVLSLYRQMIDAGYGKQLLFASDMGSHTYFASYGYGPGLAHGPSYCYDRMKREGFDQETLEQIFYHNPARVFSFAPVR